MLAYVARSRMPRFFPHMPAEIASDAVPVRRDAKILGLVGAGHFFSHFFGIALPPLFPLLQVAE